MLGKLRRYVVQKKFKAMIADFDRQIEEARAKHQPVAHLIRAKQEYVKARLEGAVSSGLKARAAR